MGCSQCGRVGIKVERLAEGIGQRPGRGHRHQAARDGKILGQGRIDGSRTDLQRKSERGILRHANIFAYQPAHRRLQGNCIARFCIGRNRQLLQQPGLALIAVIHQRPYGQALRRRPLDCARPPALRQSPFDFGGCAGVARVDPIGVPARLDIFDQSDCNGAAGRHGAVLGDKTGLYVGPGVLRLGRKSGGQQQSNACKKMSHALLSLIGNLFASRRSWLPHRRQGF